MTNQIPDPNEQPNAPQQPVPPQQPSAPQQPASGHPEQPAQPAQPGYAAPGQPQYQQPPPAASTPEQMANTVTLNYWLSVFFAWIPALIFYFIEKGKNPFADMYHRENLNFSLVRTAVGVATFIIAVIPYIGWILAMLLWIGQVVLFVFHLMAAISATERFKAGQKPNFIFNIPFIK